MLDVEVSFLFNFTTQTMGRTEDKTVSDIGKINGSGAYNEAIDDCISIVEARIIKYNASNVLTPKQKEGYQIIFNKTISDFQSLKKNHRNHHCG